MDDGVERTWEDPRDVSFEAAARNVGHPVEKAARREIVDNLRVVAVDLEQFLADGGSLPWERVVKAQPGSLQISWGNSDSR